MLLIRDPPRKKSRSGIRDPGSKNKHPGSYLLELSINFFGLQILRFFVADPDPGSDAFLTLDPVCNNSNPGTGINISDPGMNSQDPHYCRSVNIIFFILLGPLR